MKKTFILALLVVFSQFLVPCAAGEPKHFLAVFTMPSTDDLNQWDDAWGRVKPDLYLEANSFSDLPAFLEAVHNTAGDVPVDLDIDCHGEDQGLALHRDGNTAETVCSVGYICNQVDKYLDPSKTTVLLEACYSGRALHYTMEGNASSALYQSPLFEDHPNAPQYPVYGGGAANINFGNLIFLQYRSGNRVYFEDIRHWQHDALPVKVTDPENNVATVFMFAFFLALSESVH